MIKGSARGNATPGVEALAIRELVAWAPELPRVLEECGIQLEGNEETSFAFLCEEAGVEPAEILQLLESDANLRARETPTIGVDSLEVIAGTDKEGNPEAVERLLIRPGEVIALVGPTGSGKSQFLADVESLAQGDSPSGRRILLNGAPPGDELRWSSMIRPVAQVSQGMSFLLDLPVGEFLALHASCRGADDSDAAVQRVVEAACTLCGEAFGVDTPLVSLSGGQSRALMIADAVLISDAPIVLVDEIENAGIDREKALAFLVRQQTVTFIATHDPLLALRADRRVVLGLGAIRNVLNRTERERDILEWLETRERVNLALRDRIRLGEQLTTELEELADEQV